MKRLILSLLLLSSFCFGTTTITGNLKDVGTGSTSGFVRFILKGCSGNQPRVTGVGVLAPTQGATWYKDFVANSSGAVSGTIYSTRDNAGTGNGDIECGGSYTAVWYSMQVWQNGKAGPEVPIHAKAGTTIDISSVTPITTNPVVTSPTGDTTYLRTDGGNSPSALGLNIVNTIASTHPTIPLEATGIYAQGPAGGNSVWTASSSGNLYEIDGAYFKTVVPVNTNSYMNTGLSCWLDMFSNTTVPTLGIPTQGVCGLFTSTAHINNAQVWGINPQAVDVAGGLTGVILSAEEADVVVNNTGTAANGIRVGGNFLVQPSFAQAFRVTPPGANRWNQGFTADDFSITAANGAALQVGIADTPANSTSQLIRMWSYDAGSNRRNFDIWSTPNTLNFQSYTVGNVVNLTAASGELDLNAGGSNKNVGLFPTGAGIIDAHGNTSVTGTFAASGLSTLTGGFKAGAGGSTISDSRELVQSVHNCGITTTCANTANQSYRVIIGVVSLSSGTPSTATVTNISPAFTSASTYFCVATPVGATAAIAAGGVAINYVSASSFTLTGPNSVTTQIVYQCFGN